MDTNSIDQILKKQDIFFKRSDTRILQFRISKLKKLKDSIKKHEEEIIKSLNTDLGKSDFEAFTSEIGLAQKEISYHIKKLKKWAKPNRVSTPLFAFPSKSYVYKQPFGRILIIAPFNFPFMLTIIPLIGAISAGNVVVVKPSENTTTTSGVIEKIIRETFTEDHVTVIQGGIETGKYLLSKRWDKIFFTGSTRVGKIVMEAAAKNLTPVALELGGKNPVVVDKDANLKVAAKRIIWGKLLNAGQSCVSPDYLFAHEEIKDELLELLKDTIEKFYSENPKTSKDFGHIVDEKTIDRLSELIQNEKVSYGGNFSKKERYFSPTILTDVKKDSAVMQDEIFGPILPVLSFSRLDQVIQFINEKEKPLALYYFSENRKKQKHFLASTYSGDASINETVIHFSNFSLPFGGVGYSGMGSYHGKHSFECFSHSRSVMKTPTIIDLPLRYMPSRKWVLKLLRLVFR